MSSQRIPPDDKSNDAGYKRPPAASRFKKGRSGNCAGRPRGRASEAPYEAVLGQMVDIREDGLSRRVTATEALLLVMMKKSLEKGGTIARKFLAAIENNKYRAGTAQDLGFIIRVSLTPGSVTLALQYLRMAKQLDPLRETARMAIEPWLVESALGNLVRVLSPAEQRTIMKATRTPHRVKWPEWWSAFP